MPHKLLRMHRTGPPGAAGSRPVMLAIAGDSAAGKTTITSGLVRALGADQRTAVCADDYHRFDRLERKDLPFTALHPDGNYIEIMEQHLQLLATGQPVLKPVYDHRTGQLTRPEYVVPRRFVIVEGLLPLHTKLDYLARRMAQPRFANARSVRNALERARLRQASRMVAATGPLGRDDFMRLEPADFLASRVFGGLAGRLLGVGLVVLAGDPVARRASRQRNHPLEVRPGKSPSVGDASPVVKCNDRDGSRGGGRSGALVPGALGEK